MKINNSKKLLSYSITLFFIISIFASVGYAKPYSGSFQFSIFGSNIDKKNSFDANMVVKYKMWTLLNEPVIQTSAKYDIGEFVIVDGKGYPKSYFPKSVLEKLKLYNVKMSVYFDTNRGIGNLLYIDIDPGLMNRPGKWSQNIPSSPEWNKWIYYRRGLYLDTKQAIKAYKGFVRLAGKNDELALVYVLHASFDVEAAQKYIENKSKKKKNHKKRKELKSVKSKDKKKTNLNDKEEDISSSFDSIFDEDNVANNSHMKKTKQNSPVQASLLMLIDVSGSMGSEHRLEKAKEAAIQSIKTAIKNQTEVAILAFSGSCSSPISSKVNFTLNQNKLIGFVHSLRAGGGTPLGNALKRANYFMKKNKNPSSKMQMIVLLADGDGDCGNVNQVLTKLRRNKIVFRHETIGLGVGQNSRAASDLRRIAQKTGGSYHHAKSARQLKPIFMEALDTMEILDMIGEFGSN